MAKAHNKIKDIGIIFELLVDQLTEYILIHDVVNENVVKNILSTHFGENTAIYNELALYKYIINSNNIKNTDNVIKKVLENRKRIDESKLTSEKYDLIKSIKEHLDFENLFNKRINNYKLYASIHNLFSYVAGDNKIKPDLIAKSRNTIIEHITGKTHKSPLSLIDQFKLLDEQTRMLSYKLLVERFNKKYVDLNDKQKQLLSKFITSVSNSTTLKEFIDVEVNKILVELRSNADKIDDSKISIKIDETIKQKSQIFKGHIVTDNHILNLLRLYELQSNVKNIIK